MMPPAAVFALSPNGRALAVNDGRSMMVFDVYIGATVVIATGAVWARTGAFSADGAHVAGTVAGELATWRLDDGTEDDILPAPPDLAIGDLVLSADWSTAAVVDGSLSGSSLVVWNTSTLAVSRFPVSYYLDSPLAMVGTTIVLDEWVAHSPFMGDFGALHLIDATTGADLRGFAATNSTRSLFLAPDGSRAYTLETPDVVAWCR
jgi:hypothetical protein